MVTIQTLCQNPINDKKIELWGQFVLNQQNQENAEINIRFVEETEMLNLNSTYRNKNKLTNVLSFVSELPPEIKSDFIGDIVICIEVIKTEAKEQDKTIEAHLAHIVIHGVLHLLGFDHIKNDEAIIMEDLEQKYLTLLKF
jgi:probable rRNA maturation factor